MTYSILVHPTSDRTYAVELDSNNSIVRAAGPLVKPRKGDSFAVWVDRELTRLQKAGRRQRNYKHIGAKP